MGNIYSENLRIEVYKWSSAEFPQEYAIIYTSLMDESKLIIFRLSVKPEKVLLRLADFLCDEHPVRLHMEVIAERDNGSFDFRVVRMVEAGVSEDQTRFRDAVTFYYRCEKRYWSWTYDVRRETVKYGFLKKVWEVCHVYLVSLKSNIRFYVNIECDKVRGLSAELKGPFKYDYVFFEEKPGSLIKQQVNREPPKHVNAIVESLFTGKQYIIFKEGKGNNLPDEEGRMVVINNSGTFYGNGNGCFN